MIPKILAFKGASIESAIAQYESELPSIVEQFEKENGECQVFPGVFCNPIGLYIIVVTIMVNKSKAEAKKITDSGMELITQLQNRLTQVFDAEGCDHDYESSVDDNGNEKIICKKCGTPLA